MFSYIFTFYQSLGETLSSHPRVLVSFTPRKEELYAYKPVYDIQDRESLLAKLRNSGGLFLDDIKSSLPSAENVLSKVFKILLKKLSHLRITNILLPISLLGRVFSICLANTTRRQLFISTSNQRWARWTLTTSRNISGAGLVDLVSMTTRLWNF